MKYESSGAKARGTKKSRRGGTPAARRTRLVGLQLFERIAALPILDLGGRDRQAHLLAQDAGDKSPDRVSLPAGGFHEIRRRWRRRSASAGRGTWRFCCPGGRRWPSWATSPTSRPVLAFFAGVAFVADLRLGRRDVARVCGDTRLFGRSLAPRMGHLASLLAAFSGTSFILLSPLAVITATITSITRVPSDCKRILVGICEGEGSDAADGGRC